MHTSSSLLLDASGLTWLECGIGLVFGGSSGPAVAPSSPPQRQSRLRVMNRKRHAGITAPVGRFVERDVYVQGVLEIACVEAKKWEAKRVLPALSSEESKRCQREGTAGDFNTARNRDN